MNIHRFSQSQSRMYICVKQGEKLAVGTQELRLAPLFFYRQSTMDCCDAKRFFQRAGKLLRRRREGSNNVLRTGKLR